MLQLPSRQDPLHSGAGGRDPAQAICASRDNSDRWRYPCGTRTFAPAGTYGSVAGGSDTAPWALDPELGKRKAQYDPLGQVVDRLVSQGCCPG